MRIVLSRTVHYFVVGGNTGFQGRIQKFLREAQTKNMTPKKNFQKFKKLSQKEEGHRPPRTLSSVNLFQGFVQAATVD